MVPESPPGPTPASPLLPRVCQHRGTPRPRSESKTLQCSPEEAERSVTTRVYLNKTEHRCSVATGVMDQTSNATGTWQPGQVGNASPCGDPPQPQLYGGHGQEERAHCHAVVRTGSLSGTPVAAGAPCCHGQTGKTTQSLHLPRNLNQHLSLLCSVASHSNRLPGQHSLCHGGPGGSQRSVQYTAPRASPQDSVFLLTLTVGRQDARAHVALAHTRGTTEINTGRGWRRQASAQGRSPCPAPALAQPRSSPQGCQLVMEMAASPWGC